MSTDHEFGIMPKDPSASAVYEDYEPELYDCITVDDDIINDMGEQLNTLDIYWHSRKRPEKGLAYWGISLIPPETLPDFLDVLESQELDALSELISMTQEAIRKQKYLIHFGI